MGENGITFFFGAILVIVGIVLIFTIRNPIEGEGLGSVGAILIFAGSIACASGLAGKF